MEILKFYFSCILKFFRALNVDMFALGFSVLDLLLGAMFVCLVFNFLLHGFNIFESDKGLSFKDFIKKNDNGDGQLMQNNEREQQLIEANDFYRKHGYPPSGFVGISDDTGHLMRSDDYFR